MGLSLCLIGNSHVAAVKLAWSNRAPAVLPGFAIDFFSAGVRLMEHMELEGTTFVCKDDELREKIAFTSGGLESIDLTKYDAFVVIGAGFGLDVSGVCDGYDLVSPTRAPEGTLISRSFLTATIEANLESSLAMSIADKIKSVCDKPILLCAAPYLSERILSEEQFRGQMRYEDFDFLNTVVAAAKEAGARISARHKLPLIWQKEETVGVPGFTKASYGLNPARFDMKISAPLEFDRRHGNEDYGYLMLMAMLREVHELTDGRVLANAPAEKKLA